MDAFRFSPELIEYRSNVIAVLEAQGFDWLNHYTAVDPLHDVYGLEVSGITEEADSVAILKVLMEMYPAWKARHPWYQDGSRDRGWCARIQRDDEPEGDNWQTSD